MKIWFPIGVAAAIWFWMFSPWTAGITNFWLTMSGAAVVLTSLTLLFTEGRKALFKLDKPGMQLLLGAGIAFALWGVFWVGDKLSSLMFDFARPMVNRVYSMKDGFPQWLIAVLLLFVVGPAEELFWRGYVQRQMTSRKGADFAFIVTALVYAAVHIPSWNFMLVMAALVAGAVWGLIYRLKPELLPALLISHALWDALVFVILPI